MGDWVVSWSDDDRRLGYLPQGAEESEVLFTLMAERYERRSLGITSNLVFSEWEKVFANPIATAAAIDGIVHHSVILEFDLSSYRTNAAQNRQAENGADSQNQLTHQLHVVASMHSKSTVRQGVKAAKTY